MRHGVVYSLVFFWAFSAQAAPVRLGPAVLKQIPAKYDINSPALAHAKQELQELVAGCGAGVVEGVRAENRCSFHVKLDDLFFEPLESKTGFVPESEWAYRDGVKFVLAARKDAPDDYDLREFMKGGQPEIKKQGCGDCWAWSTHHGLEIARAIHDGQPYDLSVQTVLSCSHSGSCGGGSMSAVDFLKHGLPMEEDFPYTGGHDTKCKYSSSDISDGWDGKVIDTPSIGSSLEYSLALRRPDGTYRPLFREGQKVQNMMAAMYEWRSPLVVTVSAYSISGSGIYNNCSAINSGGNHMVAISGWQLVDDKRVAHVWNSWGPSHGENGISRIQWECGDGRLNRGLGVSAKIVQYKKPQMLPPDVAQPYLHQIQAGGSVQIGVALPADVSCSWTPAAGLSDAKSCSPVAKPAQTTEYHLTATNGAGTASSMTLVQVWSRDGKDDGTVLTPFGRVAYRR